MSESESPPRGRGKGESRDDGDDPAEDFEDAADSEAADDAQQTLNEIESEVEEETNGDSADGTEAGGGDSLGEDDSQSTLRDSGESDQQSTFTASELQDEERAREVADQLGLSDSGAEQIQKLGESDLSSDSPDSVNLDNATEFEQLKLSDSAAGASKGAMWIAETDEGDRMYVTMDNKEVVGNPLLTTSVAKGLNESLSEEGQQRAGFPDIHVDTEREAAILGAAGAEDSESASAFDNESADVEFSKENYCDALAAKLLMGDTDMGQNVVASSQGDFHPIDYDMGGANLKDKHEMIAQNDRLYAQSDGIYDKVQRTTQFSTRDYDFEVNASDVREATERLASEVDVESFETHLRETDVYIPSETIDDMVDNIETAREGEI
jgi:hypothetical protein